jgi:hypothetical protein
MDQLPRQVHLTGWPTPNTPSGGRSVSTEKMDATGRTADGRKHTASLEHAVKFSGWPTPVANDDNKSPEAHLAMKKRMGERDGSNSNRDQITSLQVMAKMVGWPTPNTVNNGVGEESDAKIRRGMDPGLNPADAARLTAIGETPNGSTAVTASGGVLNPALSLWLQVGPFAAAWLRCAERATLSISGRRKRSSARSCHVDRDAAIDAARRGE